MIKNVLVVVLTSCCFNASQCAQCMHAYVDMRTMLGGDVIHT